MHYNSRVSELVREETKVVGLVDGLLVIRREQVWRDGARIGGDFVCEPQVAKWLAEQLELAADDRISETKHEAPPDHLLVFVDGGEHGAPINISVLNRREPTAPNGKTHGLSGMSPEVARQLAADLRVYAP